MLFLVCQGTAGQEAEAGMEMSALVNYIQPTHFHSFELADSKSDIHLCRSRILLCGKLVQFVLFSEVHAIFHFIESICC